MLRSLYIASTGMLVQKQKMDVMTNNIANIETIGYKKDTMISSSFKDLFIERTNDPNIISISNDVGLQNTGLHVEEIAISFKQGSIEETQRLSDLALEGSGFFVVSTQQGERYTRDGSFGVNKEGYLVNADGLYVSGENGRILVGDNEFAVDENGGVFIDGLQVDRLKIVSFSDAAALRKQGSNLYYNFGNAQVLAATDTTVKQGFLENSNVDMAQAMIDVMAVSQAYQTNQRIVKMLDESLQKTVNEVGRV